MKKIDLEDYCGVIKVGRTGKEENKIRKWATNKKRKREKLKK